MRELAALIAALHRARQNDRPITLVGAGLPQPAGQMGKIQRDVHTSVAQLEADIRSFIAQHNENPKPFRWTKSADKILAAVKRFCQKTDRTLCSEL